ncbi:MAG: hypothetical protein JNJ61_20760 [Anaerolineae bacterium]|nr:hypothetical protein [Anaerolineae bacterium]
MRRAIVALLLISLLTLTTLAQEPVTTPEAAVPPGAEATPEVAVTPEAAPVSPIAPEAIPVLINARTDLELLANQVLNAERPVGWSGSVDTNDIQLPILIRLDLELLAGTILGPDQRPPGWFGAVPSTTYAIARDIRHDLETLADAVNPPNVRPPGWAGGDPLMRCSRSVQMLVTVLERSGRFTLQVDLNDPNFCLAAELQASQFAESNLNALTQPAATTSSGLPAGSLQIDSEFAVAFLTRFGSRQVGAIPLGTVISPVARSTAQFSRMMLVRGDGFEVFLDYRDTTIDEAGFMALPDVDTITSAPVCRASWCLGAG